MKTPKPLIHLFLCFCGLTLLTLPCYAEKQSFTFSLDFPGSAYEYWVDEVRLVEGEVWALTRVNEKGIGTAAITTKSITVEVDAPAGAKARQIVVGKTWKWGGNTPKRVFLEAGAEIPAQFTKGELLLKAEPPPPDKPTPVYIVSMKPEQKMDEPTARALTESTGATFKKYLGGISMFFIEGTEEQAKAIQADPRIKDVEKDR